MKIWEMNVRRKYMKNERSKEEIMKDDMEKVGVKDEIVQMEWGEYIKKQYEKDSEGDVIMGWKGENGDKEKLMGKIIG